MENVLIRNGKAIRAQLRTAKNSKLLVHTISIFQENTDALVRARLAEDHHFKLDCKKGCTFCCHLRVDALPPEVFRIARHVESLDEVRRAEMRKRLESHAEYAAGRRYGEYKKACVFLGQDGSCEIYPIRPHKCRKFVSDSVAQCERGSDNVEDPRLLGAANHLAMETIGVYRARGLDMHPAELSQAVLKALNEPGSIDRWANGERAFDPCPEETI